MHSLWCDQIWAGDPFTLPVIPTARQPLSSSMPCSAAKSSLPASVLHARLLCPVEKGAPFQPLSPFQQNVNTANQYSLSTLQVLGSTPGGSEFSRAFVLSAVGDVAVDSEAPVLPFASEINKHLQTERLRQTFAPAHERNQKGSL
ncbi:hypothetical protein EJB05_40712, partial [Eragrostis curvula]